MKRVLLLFLCTLAMSIGFASAACNLDVKLLNQDPYPAAPGEYVKLVFQADGLVDSECGDVAFILADDFPIRFDPGADEQYIVSSDTFITDYPSYAQIPFKVRVDEQALDGENEIRLNYIPNYGDSSMVVTKKFNLTIENSMADFEVTIRDYDAARQLLTFEILNIGENDVEAVTIDLPKQDHFAVKGTTRAILGGVDAHEDTSFTFEGVPTEGEITLKISYNDVANVRREVMKTSYYDPTLFSGRIKDVKQTPYGMYIFMLIVLIAIVIWVINRRRRKKKLEQMRLGRKG